MHLLKGFVAHDFVRHKSYPMGPSLVTDLYDSANANRRRNRELSICRKRMGWGRAMKGVDSRLGRHNRRSGPLRGATTTRRERGIASPETVCIGLTSKHRREDGSNDDQEGQGDDRESMHGGDASLGVGWKRGTLGGSNWGLMGAGL